MSKYDQICWESVLSSAKSEGWSVSDIAELVGCSNLTVRRRIKKMGVEGIIRCYRKKEQQQQQLSRLKEFLQQHPDIPLTEYCSRIRESYFTVIKRLHRDNYSPSDRLAGRGRGSYPELTYYLYRQEGHSVKTIADILNKTPLTIRRHIRAMENKVDGQRQPLNF